MRGIKERLFKKLANKGGEIMEIDKVLIVGAGLMGSGIAQVCAQSGIQVILNDISQEHPLISLRMIKFCHSFYQQTNTISQ